MKKLVFVLICFIFLLPAFSFAIEIDCEEAILIDADSGRVIYQKDANKKSFPASITKIMTSILTLENLKLDHMLTASQLAINSVPSGGSVVNIQVGEVISIENLLEGLLIASGNDAANVLAEGISGSMDEFVALMNLRAEELNLKNTNFVNSNGLHDENHYSSAYDLAILYRYAYNNFEDFRRIIKMDSFALPSSTKYAKADRNFSNSNKLIDPSSQYYYEFCTGGKTGYTSEAKNCLIASATKDNINLIVCVLGGSQNEANESQRYLDSKKLFEYGFDTLTTKTIFKSGDILGSIEVSNGQKDDNVLYLAASKPFVTTVDKSDINKTYDATLDFSGDILAPISSGDMVGKALVDIYGITHNIDLMAVNSIKEAPKFSFLDFLANLLLVILRIFIILVILILIIRFYNKVIRKKGRNRRAGNMRKYNARFHK